MDKDTLRRLEELKKKQLENMEAMGQEEDFSEDDLSEDDMRKLDITRRLAEGQEKARLKEIEDMAASKKMQKELDSAREAKGQADYEDKLKKIRWEEYNKEIETKGYADKSDYPDLFPELEISPREEEEKRKRQMGYK